MGNDKTHLGNASFVIFAVLAVMLVLIGFAGK